MNYLHKKKLAFMSIVNRVKGFLRTVSGALRLTLDGCVDIRSITNYKLYGQSVQNGTPTPDTPIEVESVGEYDETTGKYKIPVTVSDGTRNITTNIYLDEPLRKIGDYSDYIDFDNSKVVRNVGRRQITSNLTITLGTSPTSNGLYRCYIVPSNAKDGTNLDGYANFLPTLKQGWNKWTAEQVHFGQSNNAIYIITNEQYTSKTDFVNYLSNNGSFKPYVYYRLDSSDEQPITLPTIPTFKGTTILSIDTTIQPSNAEIEYYSTEKE